MSRRMDARAAISELKQLYRQRAELLLREAELLTAALAGVPADKLAASLDVSRSSIYGRMRLARLAAAARKALLAGELSIDVAIALADMTAAEQERWARQLSGKSARDGLKLIRRGR